MFVKFLTFAVILFSSANCGCASFDLKNQVEGNSEQCLTDWEADEERNHNFPEFEKVAEFLQPFIKHVENRKCRKQLEILVKSLQNSSLWAVQMFDASTKTPNGLLTSDAYELGNYDACIAINLKRAKEDNILGKYCLINLSTKKSDMSDEDVVSEIQFWEKLMVPIFKYGFVNNLYRSAICVPHECLPQDIENMFRYLFDNASEKLMRAVEITVSENACSTANAKEFIGLTYVKKIMPLLFLWIAVITIFDLLGWFPTSKSTWMKIPMDFSAHKNYKILTSTDCRGPIPVINCLKVYTVIILVIIRRTSFFLAGPIMNRKHVDQVFDESFRETFFDIGNNIVADNFLVLDGFLHFYRVFSYYRKNSKISTWRVFIFQFLNMCPLYLTAIFFYAYVFESVGTGPMWKERTVKFIKNCKENWMINLINLNNFFKINDTCIFESWYFAVVAQCFVIVPILAKITQKTSASGKIVFKLLIAAVIALPIVKFYRSPETFHIVANENGDVYWHQKLSTETSSRASAYFIGILASLTYLRTKESKWKRLKIGDKTLFRAALGVLFVVLCVRLNFKKTSRLQKAYCFAFRQIFWSLFISCIVFGVSTKRLTGVAPLLTGKYLLSLGRLTSSYILALDLVQIYSVGIMRTLDYFSLSRMVWICSADLLATYVVAFVFYMIVHRPVSNILHESIHRCAIL